MLNIQTIQILHTNKKNDFRQNQTKFSTQKLTSDSFVSSRSASKNPSFGTLLRITQSGRINDTMFFRGVETLKAAASHLSKKIGEINVLHYAGSTGEEAFTNRIILNNPKINLISLDIDQESVDLARKGLHSICGDYSDSFLLKPEYMLTREQKGFKAEFNKIFSPIERPDFSLNNKFIFKPAEFIDRMDEHFFQVNESAKGLVDFRDASEGNILKRHPNLPKQVDAIYARNFIYQLTGNNIARVIKDNAERADLNIEILDALANEVHSGLNDNGLFVLGDYVGEHLYITDLKAADNIKMKKLRMYGDFSVLERINAMDLELSKISPLHEALLKDDKFKPIFWDSIQDYPSSKVPTVWQKIPKNGQNF